MVRKSCAIKTKKWQSVSGFDIGPDDEHAYQDSKSCPLPLTQAQRKKFRQITVTGHLREPSERLDRDFTEPEAYSFLGMPSVDITTAVGKDRLSCGISSLRGCGAISATMCTDFLKPVLIRTYGALERFKIVEDRNRKGLYNKKGIDAKKQAKFHAIKLPSRTPSLMLSDYSIWNRIMEQLMEDAPEYGETEEEFLERLHVIATSLPKS